MGKRTVTVTGSGHSSVTPDVVRLDLRVGHEADDVAAALAGAAAGIAAVGRVVREHGVADADIRTLDAGVSQRYDHHSGTASGFTAQQRLGVTVRRPESVGDLLEAAAAAVGNALLVDQVRLDVSDRSAGLARARDAAFADARRTAQQYAALAETRLGAVLEVVEGAAASHGRPGAMMEQAMAVGSLGGMPVEGGDLDLGATVTVQWELR
ncbi:MAG: SIMPL domain-containing protein [Terracoccus sp.]